MKTDLVKGIILDGYPRTMAQVDDLLELVVSKKMKIGKVLNIDVPKAELLIRAKKRAETSDRKDDKDPLIHTKRIEVFENSTRPGIEYMKSKIKVLTFDGLGNRRNNGSNKRQLVTLVKNEKP